MARCGAVRCGSVLLPRHAALTRTGLHSKALRSSLRLPFLCSCGFTAGTEVAFAAHMGRFKSGHSRVEQEKPIGTEPPASQRETPLSERKRTPAPAIPGSSKPAASRRRTPASAVKRLGGASAGASPSASGLFSPLAPNFKRLPFMSDSP